MAGKLSNVASTLTIVSSTLGTGILLMPSAFCDLGYVLGSIIIALVGLVTFFSLYSLVYAAKSISSEKSTSYPDIAAYFSSKLSVLVNMSLIGSSIGCMIFFSRQFALNGALFLKNFEMFEKYEKETLRLVMLAIIVAICVSFFMLDSLNSLSFISYIGIFSAVYYVAMLAYYAYTVGKPMAELKMTNNGYSRGLGRLVFALHCQFSFLSIYDEMESQTLRSVCISSGAGALLAVLLYGFAGIIGYKAVGNSVGNLDMVSIFLDQKCEFMRLIKDKCAGWAYSIAPNVIIVSFMFIFFGAAVFSAFPIIPIIQTGMSKGEKPMKRSTVALSLGLMMVVSGFTEKFFDSILDFIAAVFTNPLSFVFPSIFMMMVSPKGSFNSIASILLMSMSFVLMLSALKTIFIG
jgi:amino acid permease